MSLLDRIFGAKKDRHDAPYVTSEKVLFEIPNDQMATTNVEVLSIPDRETITVFDSKGSVFYTAVGEKDSVGTGSYEVWRKAMDSDNEGNDIYTVHTHPHDMGASFGDFMANEEITRATGIVSHTIIVTPSKVYEYVPGETGFGGLPPSRGDGWFKRHGIKPGDPYNGPNWFIERAYVEYGKKHGLYDTRSPGDELEFGRRRDATIREVGHRLGFEVYEHTRRKKPYH